MWLAFYFPKYNAELLIALISQLQKRIIPITVKIKVYSRFRLNAQIVTPRITSAPTTVTPHAGKM